MSMLEIPEGVVWPPPAKPIDGPVAVGSAVVFQGRCLWMGYAATGGAAAGTFQSFDGYDTTGQDAGQYRVGASTVVATWFGPNGIWLERGLTINVTAAMNNLVLFVAGLWRPGT